MKGNELDLSMIANLKEDPRAIIAVVDQNAQNSRPDIDLDPMMKMTSKFANHGFKDA